MSPTREIFLSFFASLSEAEKTNCFAKLAANNLSRMSQTAQKSKETSNSLI